MSEKLSPEEQKKLQDVSEIVAAELADGRNKKKIVKDLVAEGWPYQSAVDFVNNMEQGIKEFKESPEGRQMLAKEYERHIERGLLWIFGGIVVTAITYFIALSSPGGGTYIFAWGAILYGLYRFLRGLAGRLKYGAPAVEEDVEELQEFTCPTCGHDINRDDRVCPGCGSEIDWSEA